MWKPGMAKVRLELVVTNDFKLLFFEMYVQTHESNA